MFRIRVFEIYFRHLVKLKYDKCWPLMEFYFMARDTHCNVLQTMPLSISIYVCEIKRLAKKSFAASCNKSCIEQYVGLNQELYLTW